MNKVGIHKSFSPVEKNERSQDSRIKNRPWKLLEGSVHKNLSSIVSNILDHKESWHLLIGVWNQQFLRTGRLKSHPKKKFQKRQKNVMK